MSRSVASLDLLLSYRAHKQAVTHKALTLLQMPLTVVDKYRQDTKRKTCGI